MSAFQLLRKFSLTLLDVSTHRALSISLAIKKVHALKEVHQRDWWNAVLEGEMEKLAVEESVSVTAGGSMNPERKADHRSARTVLTIEESEEVKGAENERQGTEVDDVIPETQPTSNEADGGFLMCEVVEQQAARVEVQGPKKE